MLEVNILNPIHGVNAVRVIQTLVRKGRTIDTLKTRPGVRFTEGELTQLSRFPSNPVTNQFVNQVVQLALSGNKVLLAMFRSTQLNTIGITATVHGDKPAVVDLELLGMYYHGSGNIEAKAIRYNKDFVVKPEDLKSGASNMPLTFRWGVIKGSDDKLYCKHGVSEYVPNSELTKWLISSPIILADVPSSKPEESEKPVEIDGLVFKGLDGGKKLEISSKEKSTDVKSIILPFLTKWDEEIKFVKLNIECKRR